MLAEGARPAQAPSGEPYRLGGWWSCGCDALLADFTHGPTRDGWTDRYAEILASGMHGLWTDLGEPKAHPSNMQHAAGPADAIHNVYNLLWAQTVQETFREQRPNRRVVNLARSGDAGIQRHGVFTWSADVGRLFPGLARPAGPHAQQQPLGALPSQLRPGRLRREDVPWALCPVDADGHVFPGYAAARDRQSALTRTSRYSPARRANCCR